MRSWRSFLLAAAAAFTSALGGCSSSEPSANTPGETNDDCGITVDRFKSIAIVDDAVVNDARAKNATRGPWSFAYTFESMTTPGQDVSKFVMDWLTDWATETTVNGFPLDLESREAGLNDYLLCPWLKQTPENGCNTDCSTCTTRKLDMGKAPFRLVAIVSRLDLGGRPDPDATSAAGEARFIYGLTNGPADDPASTMRAMTMILEYALPDTLSQKEWAEAWNHLGTHATFDEAYKAELEALTQRYAVRGASPERNNGSALARIRTNESVFNWIWQLRQFTIDAGGQLKLSTVTNTPAAALNGTDRLRDWIVANAEAVKQDVHLIPTSMLGGSSDQLLYRWTLKDVDESLRSAFARTTCNGCHSGEHTPIDTAFHISPFRSGTAKLSPFMYNPADPSRDDLGKREAIMKSILCKP